MTNKILALIAASLMATASYSAQADDAGVKADASGSAGVDSEIKVPGSSADAGASGDVGAGADVNAMDDMAADSGDTTATDDMASGSNDTATDDMAADTESDTLDTQTTASIGEPNFGMVISSIRAGKSDLSGITPTSEVEVIDVSTLEGSDSQALDNALSEKQSDIDALRSELSEMELEGVEDSDIENVVAVNTEADGSVTLFTYDDSM